MNRKDSITRSATLSAQMEHLRLRAVLIMIPLLILNFIIHCKSRNDTPHE